MGLTVDEVTKSTFSKEVGEISSNVLIDRSSFKAPTIENDADAHATPLGPDSKEDLFFESRARRAARKSEVLGHFVRAPNLTNIIETTEMASKPSSIESTDVGCRGSNRLKSSMESAEVSDNPVSAGVKFGRSAQFDTTALATAEDQEIDKG